jgi:hypothetical protein
MTQICIQLDDSILKALEATAARNNTSVSEWIKDRIHQELKPEWPDNYFSLFGVLDEDDLLEPTEIPFKHEAKREEL